MPDETFSRFEGLIGSDALAKLKNSRVILFGLGGVGSYVCEALVRSGTGHITIVDSDKVDITNINRQLIALHSTVGQYKTEAEFARIKDISPECDVNIITDFYTPEKRESFFSQHYDYCIDAIDNVTAKIDIICACKDKNIPVISCMGTGNKLDPSKIVLTDIYKTSVCPLAKVVRHELKARGIKDLQVVYSTELPALKTTPPRSSAFVPGTAGLLIAAKTVNDLILSSDHTDIDLTPSL